jgi:hypothetical protein
VAGLVLVLNPRDDADWDATTMVRIGDRDERVAEVYRHPLVRLGEVHAYTDREEALRSIRRMEETTGFMGARPR